MCVRLTRLDIMIKYLLSPFNLIGMISLLLFNKQFIQKHQNKKETLHSHYSNTRILINLCFVTQTTCVCAPAAYIPQYFRSLTQSITNYVANKKTLHIYLYCIHMLL